VTRGASIEGMEGELGGGVQSLRVGCSGLCHLVFNAKGSSGEEREREEKVMGKRRRSKGN
jgi:hypothetical protein